jgi:hypothetical protein
MVMCLGLSSLGLGLIVYVKINVHVLSVMGKKGEI